MNKRSLAIAAISALFIGTSAMAEPTQPKLLPAQLDVQPATVVLASNTTVVPNPGKEGQNVPSPKKRTARVTSCRCGDPEPVSGALLELRDPH